MGGGAGAALLRFLIDENLSPHLASRAVFRGYVGVHTNWLGMRGRADSQIMTAVLREDYTFVTNNRVDFLRLYARERLHAGLIVILPVVMLARQIELFDAALDRIEAARFDMVNTMVEVSAAGEVTIGVWPRDNAA